VVWLTLIKFQAVQKKKSVYWLIWF